MQQAENAANGCTGGVHPFAVLFAVPAARKRTTAEHSENLQRRTLYAILVLI